MHAIVDHEAPDLKPFPIKDEELLERFECTFTAVCVDIMDMLFDLHDQVLPNYLKPLSDNYKKVAGFAFTIKGMSSPIPEDEAVYNERQAEFMSSFPYGSITVWDTSGDDQLSQYGEMMSFTSMSQGCRAAVVDGGARDVERIIEMGFRVWSKTRTPKSMWHRHRMVAWQVPIKIGGVDIFPGDIVFADMDGIVIIPRGIAYDVLLEAEKRRKEELTWRDILASGVSPVEAFKQGVKF